jgi:hypothetical protein
MAKALVSISYKNRLSLTATTLSSTGWGAFWLALAQLQNPMTGTEEK